MHTFPTLSAANLYNLLKTVGKKAVNLKSMEKFEYRESSCEPFQLKIATKIDQNVANKVTSRVGCRTSIDKYVLKTAS